RGGEGVAVAPAAGGVLAAAVAEPGDHPRLVLRDPTRDTVAEPRDDDLDVLRERLDRVPCRPAALVLERLREVPVVERRERLEAGRGGAPRDAPGCVRGGGRRGAGRSGRGRRRSPPRDPRA